MQEEQYQLISMQKGELRKESNDWLDDGPSSPARCNKHSPKSPTTTPIEKTQRIKKPKKQRKASREEPKEVPTAQSTEDRLVSEAVARLRVCHSRQGGPLPIYKKLTRERLLQFLEMIEGEYSLVVSAYLGDRRGGEASGSLKALLLRFIDGIIAAFPVLNNIVFQYAFQYYTSGPLQARFGRLMDRNITPILKLISQKYNRLQPTNPPSKHDLDASTHFSHSPERQHLEDFQSQDTKKSEKRRRQRNKKKEGQQIGEAGDEDEGSFKLAKLESKAGRQQVDRSVQQLTNFLQNLSIDKEARVECRIEEQQITRWKKLCQKSSFTKS